WNVPAKRAAGGAVSALAQEALRSMLMHKIKITALTALAWGAVATGAGLFTHSLAMIQDEPKSAQTAQQGAPAEKPDNAREAPAPGRMFVVGRVLDPAGKPVPGAAVMVHARNLTPSRPPFLSRLKMIPLGDARADGSGRFRIEAPRTSSTRHDNIGAVAMA